MRPILIKSMQGIGDNIFQRPYVKALVERGEKVYIQTPLPFLYDDIDVSFVKPDDVPWRTQAKVFNQLKGVRWKSAPKNAIEIDPFYSGERLVQSTIPHCIQEAFMLEDFDFKFDLPEFPTHRLYSDKRKIAVIRPVTIRKEWRADGRAPLPHYINWCAGMLKRSGYHVISIADLKEGEEWLVGNPPVAHQHLHSGELSIPEMLGLIQNASIVVGGPGFIIPASVAANVPLFVVYGGRGGYDSPAKDFDVRMNLKKVGWALPDNFCRCTYNNEENHSCDKKISNLDDQFMKFMQRL